MNSLTVILLALLIAIVSATTDTINGLEIVNGESAKLGELPHQASLRSMYSNKHFCGGTILSLRWILTAHHCVASPARHASSIFAVVGSVKLDRGGIPYQISRIVSHPREHISADIALLRTVGEIKLNDYVQPAHLPNEDTPADTLLMVSGWGLTSYVDKNE